MTYFNNSKKENVIAFHFNFTQYAQYVYYIIIRFEYIHNGKLTLKVSTFSSTI